MSGLLKRLKEKSTIAEADILSQSKYYDEDFKDVMPTEIPMLNTMLGGDPSGGLSAGVTMVCGDSKTFKTGFLLDLAKGFLNKHKDGTILFYDSEFGAPIDYFQTRGINMDQVLHVPIQNIEEMKHDMAVMLNELREDDKCLIIVDSVGGLASIKEATDAIEKEASPVDMTRAKALNSWMRIVTPQLNMKNVPLVFINHYYETQEMYPKPVISGGKKVELASDDVWLIKRSQDGTANDLKGYFFRVIAHKSRVCKEKSEVEIHVTFEDGINRMSGIFENAKEAGLIQQAGAWYKPIDLETGEVSPTNKRRGQIEGDTEYMQKLLEHLLHY